MTKYRRLWPCGVCGKSVIYDDEAHTVSCGCSTVHDVKMMAWVVRANFEKVIEK